MSMLELERIAQHAQQGVALISTPDLRLLRAWLADVVISGESSYTEGAATVGRVVQVELLAREMRQSASPKKTRRDWLENLAVIPDLQTPAQFNHGYQDPNQTDEQIRRYRRTKTLGVFARIYLTVVGLVFVLVVLFAITRLL